MSTVKAHGPEASWRKLFEASLDCYLAAIRETATGFAECCPEVAAAHQEKLLTLSDNLKFGATAAALAASRETLRDEMAAFRSHLRQRGNAAAESSTWARTSALLAQLRDLACELELLREERDPFLLSERLRGCLHWLRAPLAHMSEIGNAAEGAELEIRKLRSRMREAEMLACLDPVTGLANRRELDRQWETRVRERRQFCLVVFDLNGFKRVNDQCGHLAGDQILQRIGEGLVQQVRSRDFVCRWGGDEFAVLLDCGLTVARRRCAQIAANLSTTYSVNALPGMSIEVGVVAGVAEQRDGEALSSLFARADAILYQAKRTRIIARPATA